MKMGSLFTGIGGIDLGLERAGIEVVWQVEIEPSCRKVLEVHWPNVRCYSDICTLDFTAVEPVDLLAGGFPCQPVSDHGRRDGVTSDRWLWPEMARAIRELRPKFVLVENLPALVRRGLSHILRDLASCGYDAEWNCLPAAAFGAPHKRERIVLVAYPRSQRFRPILIADPEHGLPHHGQWDAAKGVQTWEGWQRWLGETVQAGYWAEGASQVCGVADGSAAWVDRIHALGNSAVPQVFEWVGGRILQADREA